MSIAVERELKVIEPRVNPESMFFVLYPTFYGSMQGSKKRVGWGSIAAVKCSWGEIRCRENGIIPAMGISKHLAAVSIFVGSFLLFLIQPMVGNFLLPHFGGTSAVWVTCLCTFQVLLIVGYAYAHFLSGRLGTMLHSALLLVAAAVFVPAMRMSVGVVEGIGSPMLAIIAFLTMTVAVPYVLVGANASLVQSLVARDRGGYRLYAVSNSGSFFGLICYPFVIEGLLPIGEQLVLYSVGMSVYALLLAALLFAVGGGAAKRKPSVRLLDSFRDRRAAGWFALSAVSCFLLDAVSAHLCTDIVPLPLLWCGILALYLLTWVIGFTEKGARLGLRVAPVAALLSLAAILHLGRYGAGSYVAELVLGLAVLFFGSWFVHSWLYGRRPEVERLTHYYFVIALGGGFGGILAALVAPLVFPFVAEYPLALTLLVFSSLLVVRRDWTIRGRILKTWQIGIVACAVGVLAFFRAQIVEGALVFQCRNFYGTVKVVDSPKGTDRTKECMLMYNNGTTHGFQLADGDWRGYRPTAYYTELGGGMCIEQHPKRKAGQPLRAAFLGMGIGTLAAYGRKGDEFRFYEINPNVPRIANDLRYFTFTSKSDAVVSVVVDDARKALEREAREHRGKYDLIVVDVFSGDAIPPHMATREAVSLYLDRLDEGGVLAFHISNWHLNLWPIMRAIADGFGLRFAGVSSQPHGLGIASQWAYFSRDDLSFDLDADRQQSIDRELMPVVPLMTDDYHPMLGYFNNRFLGRIGHLFQRRF